MRFSLGTTLCVLVLLAGVMPGHADYAEITVEEYAGMTRRHWPVHIGVAIPAETPLDNLWLGRVVQEAGDSAGEEADLTPIPFQVLTVVTPDDAWRDRLKSIDLVFPVNLKVHESARYRLYFGDDATARPHAEPEYRLTIETGDHLIRLIDTGPAQFSFHENSGQLFSYRSAKTKRLVDFAQFGGWPIHYTPDVRKDGAFRSVRSWDVVEGALQPQIEEAGGPLAWRMVRVGPLLPDSDAIEVSVTYTAYAGMPFLLESSAIRFKANTAVEIIRNNELVFTRGLQTHGIYLDHAMQTHTFRVYNPDDYDERFRHIKDDILPADIPFIGLFHESAGDGFGAVTLDRAVFNPRALAADGGGGAHYYFNELLHKKPIDSFTYLARAELFNFEWGRSTWRNVAQTVVPDGSVFAERSAFLVFNVGLEETDDPRFAELNHWVRRLRHPPRVRVTKDGRR